MTCLVIINNPISINFYWRRYNNFRKTKSFSTIVSLNSLWDTCVFISYLSNNLFILRGYKIKNLKPKTTIAFSRPKITFRIFPSIIAGTCWVTKLDGGRCKQPMAQNISRAECCAAGVDAGFTDGEMNQFQYMISIATGSGGCQSCIGLYTSHIGYLWNFKNKHGKQNKIRENPICLQHFFLFSSTFIFHSNIDERNQKTPAIPSIVARTNVASSDLVNANVCAP